VVLVVVEGHDRLRDGGLEGLLMEAERGNRTARR
jgi:hypothetical protein